MHLIRLLARDHANDRASVTVHPSIYQCNDLSETLLDIEILILTHRYTILLLKGAKFICPVNSLPRKPRAR